MKLAVLTGAGMSAESGIATFRDALTGLWSRFDPEALACEAGFRRDPALVWGWYRWRAAQVLGCEPNAGHRGLAELERQGHEVTVITQNVDDLHERAGSSHVIHLHGHLLRARCIECGRGADPDPMALGLEAVPAEGGREMPPACAQCGGKMRPGVVWFGEALPQQAWEQAVVAVQACERLVVIGTSGLVQPAASLPLLALETGIPVLEINPQSTPLSRQAGARWPCGAGEGVARLAQRLADTEADGWH